MAMLYEEDSLNFCLYDIPTETTTPNHRIIPRDEAMSLPTPNSASCSQLFAITNSPEYCYYDPSVEYINTTPGTSTSSSICTSPISRMPLLENTWQDQLAQEPATPQELFYLDSPPEIDADICGSGCSSVTDSRSISPQLLEDPYVYIQQPSQQLELAPAPQIYSVYQPLPSPVPELPLQPQHHYYSIPQHQAASLALSLACGTAFSKQKPSFGSTCVSPSTAANGAGISKPHRCKHCHKTFKRLEHLKRHLKIHTDERPYQCDVAQCGRRFSRSDNLRAHRRTHMKKGGRNLFIEGLQADIPVASSTM